MREPKSYCFFVYENQDLSEAFELGFNVKDNLVRHHSDFRQFQETNIWPEDNGWIRVDKANPKIHYGQCFGEKYTEDGAPPEVYLDEDDPEMFSEPITYEEYLYILGGGESFLNDNLEVLL